MYPVCTPVQSTGSATDYGVLARVYGALGAPAALAAWTTGPSFSSAGQMTAAGTDYCRVTKDPPMLP